MRCEMAIPEKTFTGFTTRFKLNPFNNVCILPTYAGRFGTAFYLQTYITFFITMRLIGLVVLLFCYSYWILPACLWGIEDLRLVNAFHADQIGYVGVLKTCLTNNTFYFHAVYHGHLYFNTCLVLLNTWALFTQLPLTDTQILIVLRVVPFIYSISCLLFIYYMAKTYWKGVLAYTVAVAYYSLAPKVLFTLNTIAYPDTMLLFWLLVSMHFVIKFATSNLPITNNKFMLSFFASIAAAAMAFAAKYSGLLMFGFVQLWFLLIVFWNYKIADDGKLTSVRLFRAWITMLLAFCLIWASADGNYWASKLFSSDGFIENPNINRYIVLTQYLTATMAGFFLVILFMVKGRTTRGKQIIVAANGLFLGWVVFSGLFLLASPYTLKGLQFVNGLVLQQSITNSGWFTDPNLTPSGWYWLHLLTSNQLLGVIGSIFLLLATIKTLFIYYKNRQITPQVVIATWILGVLGYFIVSIRMYEARYIAIILPFAALLIGYLFDANANRQFTYFKNQWSNLGLYVFLTVFLVVEIINMQTQVQMFLARTTESPIVKIGQFLAQNFDADCRIYGDGNAYIPAKFLHYKKENHGNFNQMLQFNPDIVLLNHQRYRYFSKASDSTQLHIIPAQAFLAVHNFYQHITNSTNFKSIYKINELELYEKIK